MEKIDDSLIGKALSREDSTASEVSSPITQTIRSTEFAVLWAKLCAAYPRQQVTSATAEVFFEQLSTYTAAQVSDAVSGVIATSKWFPAVAEIIEQINGGYHCPHVLERAELRIKRAELDSRWNMLNASEEYSDKRLKKLADKCAELEGRSSDLYKRDRQMLEESGLLEAQKKLDRINEQIQEQEHTLTVLKQKVKLFDQARMLQTDDGERT